MGQGAIDDPQHVLPGHVRPKAPHMWHPVLCRLVEALHIAVLPRKTHLAQSGRIPGAQPGVAADTPFGARAGQPGLGAFADQGAFELGGGAQHLERELTLWGGCVDRVLERTEKGTLCLQPLDYLQEMRQRPRKPVDPHDDQRVALADPFEHPRKHRSGAIAA